MTGIKEKKEKRYFLSFKWITIKRKEMYISSPIFNGHAVASNETKFTSKTNIVSLVLTQKGLGPPVTTISTQQKSELEGNRMNLDFFFF